MEFPAEISQRLGKFITNNGQMTSTTKQFVHYRVKNYVLSLMNFLKFYFLPCREAWENIASLVAQ